MLKNMDSSSMLTESLLTAFEQPRSPTPSDSSSRTQSPQPGIGPPMPNISLDILSAETHDSQSQLPRQSRDSTHSLPVVRDTFKVSGNTHRTSDHHQSSQQPRHHRQSVDHHDTTSLNSSVFDFLSYSEVDSGQRQEFQFLLAKETSWRRVCCHKGLVANLFFLVLMVAGIVLGEVLFPLEGFRGNGRAISNDTVCLNNIEGCISVRVLRAVGLFGFIGGITNWVAIEMLFVRVPFLIGTGVIAKQYKEIREGIHRIVVNTLFDPAAVSEYFSGHKKYAIEMLHLGQHFGGLLDSAAANAIVEQKIESALKGPEGFVLTMLGVDHSELKSIIRKNVQLFLADISPIVLDKISPGLMDGEALQAEVERILEQKIEELSANKVHQIITLIIRKHLSWLILWGNLSGAVIGLLSELVSLLAAYLLGDLQS